MRSYPIKTLVDRARRYADMEYTPFVSNDPELLDYLNVAYGEYYDLLTDSQGDYFRQEVQINLNTTTTTYDLPEDFYKITLVEYVLSAGQRAVIKPYNTAEKDSYSFQNNVVSGLVEITYIPAPEIFETLDTGFIDGQSGWEDYISTHMAIQMLAKEESSTTLWERKLEALKVRIASAAATRDQLFPQTTTDIHRVNPYLYWQSMRYRLNRADQISIISTTFTGWGGIV